MSTTKRRMLVVATIICLVILLTLLAISWAQPSKYTYRITADGYTFFTNAIVTYPDGDISFTAQDGNEHYISSHYIITEYTK
jgi:hypothetical protein